MLKTFLVLVYVCWVVPVGVLGRLLGRDSLLLRRSRRDSYWLAKAPVGNVQSYFSTGSTVDGNGTTADTPPSVAGPLASFLLAISRLYAPRRQESSVSATSAVPSAATREQGIPDEIYTLW